MPSSHIRRPRIRALLFISICVALVVSVSLWTSRNYASAAADKGGHGAEPGHASDRRGLARCYRGSLQPKASDF